MTSATLTILKLWRLLVCLSQVSLCERHAGSGLQITLEGERTPFVGKLDDDINRPRPVPDRVTTASGAVIGVSRPNI
jgi:hypothetical protein